MHARAPEEKKLDYPPEFGLLRAAWRWVLLVLLFAAAGLAAGYLWVWRSTDLFQAEAEILVRYAYEYTPLSVESGSDSMQLRIDPDLALNSEVQMLMSPPVIAAALKAAPIQASGDMAGDPEQRDVEEAARMIAVSRIEGTSIIHIAVRARDGAWARRFTSALLDAYRMRRAELFSSREEMESLQVKREELGNVLRDLEVRSAEVSGALLSAASGAATSQSLVLWARAGLDLIQTIGGADDAASSLAGSAAPTGAASPQLSLVGRLLQEFLAGRPLPAGEAGAEREGIDAAARENERLREISDEAAEIEERREAARTALAKTEDLIQRIEFRRDVGQRVEVLTPPYTLGKPVGFPPALKIVLSGILGLMLGLFVAVLAEGTLKGRRLSASPARRKVATD